MAKRKVESFHSALPRAYNSKENPNWKAIVEALGESDQEVADLIENVRKQFFVKTATRPYIDRLGAQYKVQRPRFIGMRDPDFRTFIPIMSYHPKQVKLVFDKLLDLFFIKDSTTSFTQTIAFEDFYLEDGWTLEYEVDAYKTERIQFNSKDFTNIAEATADEIVAAINRQTTGSYGIAHYDSITKKTYIRIFTDTIGSKGSIRITGGLANIGLQFNNFNTDSGNGINTEWNITKVGDLVTFQYVGGDDPRVNSIEVDDIVMINVAGNKGTFAIESVNINDNSFQFRNVFATAGTLTQTSTTDVKFMYDETERVHTRDKRAVSWEVTPGEIIVELPPSPPIVKRNRRGAAHINGTVSLSTIRVSDTELTLVDATDFPETGGKILIEQLKQIKSELIDSSVANHNYNSRLISDQGYFTYTGKSGNTLTGISPDLPKEAALNKVDVASVTRASNELLVTTITAHNFLVNESAILEGTVGFPGSVPLDGTWEITEVIDSTSFKVWSPGDDGSTTSAAGSIRVERIGMLTENTKVILRSSTLQSETPGPYVWDEDADFVLSSFTTNLTTSIQAGVTQRNILVEANDIPNESGQLVFDFGTEKEEGPVKYFFKPSTNTISIDPAYVFLRTHDVGSSVTMIRRRGGIVFDGFGSERAPYITDPAVAREVLKELMEEVKSVGVFLNFLVRYPVLNYSTLDVYKSNVDPDDTYYQASHPELF